MLMAAFAMTCMTVSAQDKTETFKVSGNCGMCKRKIEKAATTDGVSAAVWNKDTKMITVTYDAAKISNAKIQQNIAAVGYDTEKFKADDKVYDKLPGCCKYDRDSKAGKKEDPSGHKH